MRREDSYSHEGVSNQVEAKVKKVPWGKDLFRYLHELSAIIKPKCIVLFGSTARGDWDAYSDIDVLIISDDLPDDFFKSLTILYKPRRGRVQPFGYNSANVEKMIVNRNDFIINTLKDATPIMGEEYYNRLITLLQERERESQRF
jgi:predicted nucleotidyltransferase